MKNPLRVLWELYVEGGIEVLTSDVASQDTPGAQDRQVLVRTIIQPDADVVTRVAPTVLDRRDIWEAHVQQIRSEIQSLGQVRSLVRWLRLPSYVLLPLGLYNLAGLPGPLSFGEAAFTLVPGALLFLSSWIPSVSIGLFLRFGFVLSAMLRSYRRFLRKLTALRERVAGSRNGG